MHQSWTQADSPQGSRAHLVAAAFKILFREIPGHALEDLMTIVLASSLQYSVAGAYVVHQEVSIGMQCQGSERRRNAKCTTVDLCSRRSCSQRLDVTSRTANFVKKFEAS